MPVAQHAPNVPAFGKLSAAMLAASEAVSQLASLRDKAREAEKVGIDIPSLKTAAEAPRAALKAAYEMAVEAFEEIRETADWRCAHVMLATRGGAKAPKAAASYGAAKADEVAAKAAVKELKELLRAHASGPDVWADNTALMISRAHRAAIAREAELAEMDASVQADIDADIQRDRGL